MAAIIECESSICTTLLDKREKKLLSFKELIMDYFCNRVSFLYSVRGKDQARAAWHLVLVDTDKKEQFLKQTKSGSVDVADFGSILHSGWGDATPGKYFEIVDNIAKWHPPRVHLIVKEMGKFKYYFYVLCNANAPEMNKSEAILPQVKSCCKLLHAGWGQDVPEAVADLLVKSVLKHNFKSNWSEYDGWVSSSARNGEVDRLKSLSKVQVKILDSNGWTLLHHAAYGGSIDVINYLIGNEADVDVPDKVCGCKPVHIACREGHIGAVKLFLQNGMDVNDSDYNNWTLLHYASWSGNIELVQFLIKKDANMQAKELFNMKIPLHIAARKGHTQIVDLFCCVPMDIESKDAEGRTPLYYAAYGDHFDTLKFLVDKGASVHCRNTNGVSISHLACLNNNLDMLEYLFKKKCGIEAKDVDGWTILHFAASKDAFECVNYLCKEGANLTALSKSLKTPLDLAKEYNSTDVIDFLLVKEAERICDKENYKEALQVYRKLLNIQSKKLGSSHLDTLDTRSKIAALHSKLEEHAEALQIHTDVYSERKRILKTYHPDTLMSHYKMGSAMESLFRYTDAGSIYEAVYVKRKELLGADHEDTLQVRHDLASIYVKQGRWDVASNIFQDVYHRRKYVLGPNHLDTLKSCQEVGVVLANAGELTHAVRHFKEVYEIRKEVLGPDHPDTSFAKRHVTFWSEKVASSQIHTEQNNSMIGNWVYKGLKNLNIL